MSHRVTLVAILSLHFFASGFNVHPLWPRHLDNPNAAMLGRGKDIRTMKAVELERRDVFAALVAGYAAATVRPRDAALAVATRAAVCDQAISHLVDESGKRDLYLIGTAHISSLSAALVEQTIRSVRPDLVMVELDESRVKNVAKAGTQQVMVAPPATPTRSGGGGGTLAEKDTTSSFQVLGDSGGPIGSSASGVPKGIFPADVGAAAIGSFHQSQ